MKLLDHRICSFEGFGYMFTKIVFYKAYTNLCSHQQINE